MIANVSKCYEVVCIDKERQGIFVKFSEASDDSSILDAICWTQRTFSVPTISLGRRIVIRLLLTFVFEDEHHD